MPFRTSRGLGFAINGYLMIVCRSKGGAGESYEKTAARHGDRTFSKFQKRISLCPEQILRYVAKLIQ